MTWLKNAFTPVLEGMADGGTTKGGARLVVRPEMKKKGLVKVRGLDPRSWRAPILDKVRVTLSLGLPL